MDAISLSSLPSVLARNKRMTRPAAVKNRTVMPSRQAFLPNAIARWVLPVPGGPNMTTSSGRLANSNDSSDRLPQSTGKRMFSQS